MVRKKAPDTIKHPGLGEVSMLGSALHVDGAPLPVRHPAPGLGAQTEDVLRELGYSAPDIDRFRGGGAI